MPNGTDLQFYIEHGREERYLEYKRAMIWTDDDTKVKIVKAMMAMANLRNGGVIVVGMQEVKGTWEPEVMTPQQISSFNQDHIATCVNDYATPAVRFSVMPFALNGNQFIVIQVQEFANSPIICRKQWTIGGREALGLGTIYYRNNRKNESAPIATDQDLRELIGLAVEQGIINHVGRLHRLGLIPTESAKQLDSAQYEKERNGL